MSEVPNPFSEERRCIEGIQVDMKAARKGFPDNEPKGSDPNPIFEAANQACANAFSFAFEEKDARRVRKNVRGEMAILPVIVTNAPLYVVDDKSLLVNPTSGALTSSLDHKDAQWLVLQHPFSSAIPGLRDGSDLDEYVGPSARALHLKQGVAVVNVASIEDFLTKLSFAVPRDT